MFNLYHLKYFMLNFNIHLFNLYNSHFQLSTGAWSGSFHLCDVTKAWKSSVSPGRAVCVCKCQKWDQIRRRSQHSFQF